jgi:hypothetical protein
MLGIMAQEANNADILGTVIAFTPIGVKMSAFHACGAQKLRERGHAPLRGTICPTSPVTYTGVIPQEEGHFCRFNARHRRMFGICTACEKVGVGKEPNWVARRFRRGVRAVVRR